MSDETISAQALAAKGNGVLVKTGSVWSYSGAPLDPSGTNLRLPLEYVQQSEIDEAVASGDAVVTTRDFSGLPLAVQFGGEEPARVLLPHQVGTVEASTELPSSAPYEVATVISSATQPEDVVDTVEGAEKTGVEGGRQINKEPTSENNPRKGR